MRSDLDTRMQQLDEQARAEMDQALQAAERERFHEETEEPRRGMINEAAFQCPSCHRIYGHDIGACPVDDTPLRGVDRWSHEPLEAMLR